jgi:hypothetical protein
MFLQNFHIFKNKRAMLRQKFTVQVTTLPDFDDITRFDGMNIIFLPLKLNALSKKKNNIALNGVN